MKFPCVPENEEERLKSLYLADLLDTRDDERFERLTRLAKRIFQVPVVLISLLDRERQWLLACQGLGIRQTRRDISFAPTPSCRTAHSSLTMRSMTIVL